ncbi:MAG: IS630 family transposase [Planctomycetes bacterium]|nr:IS630 family transposase [Planctomycetota bacterium]
MKWWRLLAAACRTPRDLGHERANWSHQAIADVLCEGAMVEGISASSVGRILRAGDIRPHRVKMWCHSTDPLFREKLHDVVGLYLDPPPGEPVLCVDEKSGMQALSRRRGLIHAQPGRSGRLEFEHRRNGTRCLFGCFNVRTGRVLDRCSPSRKREDFLSFMDLVASTYRQGRVHVVLDNLNTHHDTSAGDFITQWNRRHGDRFVFHYTPTHGSWLNQIELWFGILSRRILKHGSFETAAELERAVMAFVEQWNEREAHPFRWTYEGTPLAA